jgi:hypothetical protein
MSRKAYERWGQVLSWVKKHDRKTSVWSQEAINVRYK